MILRLGVGLLGIAITTVALVHCSGGGSDTDSDGGLLPDGASPTPTTPGTGLPPTLPVPTDHRATADACATTRGPGVTVDAGSPGTTTGAGSCTSDADCTAGKNGRCMNEGRQIYAYACSYDECTTDSDCGGTNVCLCALAGNGSGSRSGHRCLPSDCRVDSDCGSGGYCSPTYDTTCGSYDGLAGYDCHTAADTCTSDAQCNDGGMAGYCAFQPTVNHWGCSYGFCAGH